MCLTDEIEDDNQVASRPGHSNQLHSPLLLPNDLEHEVPSLASSRGSGWVVLGDRVDQESTDSDNTAVNKSHVKMFAIFVGLVLFGATNSVSAKLQTIPM